MLTLDAAKHFMLQAPTENGKLVRQYFIDAEKAFRVLLEQRMRLDQAVVEGRITVTDNATGETYNPLGDPHYVDSRMAAAQGHVLMNGGIRDKYPDIPAAEFPKLNANISAAVLGKTPRKFLRDNKLIQKRKNRKGRMVYPKHPNGREVMTKPQIGTVTGLQAVCGDVYKKAKNAEAAKAECERRLAIAKDLFSPLHGQHLASPLLLEDVKEYAYAQAMICA